MKRLHRWLFWRTVRRELFAYHLMVADYAWPFALAGVLDEHTTRYCRESSAAIWRGEHSRPV